jgi:hypothetical protein
MDDKQYRHKLLVYSVLVVIASICGSGTPILVFMKLPSAASIALGIAAIFLFVYKAPTLRLSAWAGSAIYLVTRKPNVSTQ